MAALVLAKMPPAPLMALSRKSMAKARKSGKATSKAEANREVVRQWHALWDNTQKAAWTRRLIPDVRRLCFQKYLFSKARAHSPACVHCQAPDDDAEHTVFVCPFWDTTRHQISTRLGRPPGPEDVADLLCLPPPDDLPPDKQQRDRILAAARTNSNLFHNMVEGIMSKKEELERSRQMAEAVRQN